MKNKNSLLIVIFFLLIFGLIIIANTTVVSSSNLYGNPYKFTLLQAVWVVFGSVAFFYFYHTDYRKLEKFSSLLLVITLIFLVVLAVISLFPCNANFMIAPCVNGANRWIYLNPAPLPKIPFLGVIGLQPGEIAKLALILYLSFQLAKKIRENSNPFWTYLIASGLVALLVLMQPNMSTAVMLFILGSIIYFSSGSSLKELFIVFPTLLAVGLIAIFSSDYRRSRFLTLLSGNSDTDLTSGYHIKQILLALGSGGFWGVGFGQSKQKFNYLPEVASDSIFAIIGEEFGFIGTTIIILLFSFLIYKGFSIAKKSKDLTGRLLAVGITSWIGLQFFVNVAAMTKIVPLTGVPLPLVSYGGSSMLFSMIALGILANIGRQE